jgi:hypothetical protein
MIANRVSFGMGVSDVDNIPEYVLAIRFVGGDWQIIKTWDKLPSTQEVGEIKQLVMTSFKVYHDHLHIPLFNVHEVTNQETSDMCDGEAKHD